MSQINKKTLVQNKKYITRLALVITDHAPRFKPFG